MCKSRTATKEFVTKEQILAHLNITNQEIAIIQQVSDK